MSSVSAPSGPKRSTIFVVLKAIGSIDRLRRPHRSIRLRRPHRSIDSNRSLDRSIDPPPGNPRPHGSRPPDRSIDFDDPIRSIDPLLRPHRSNLSCSKPPRRLTAKIIQAKPCKRDFSLAREIALTPPYEMRWVTMSISLARGGFQNRLAREIALMRASKSTRSSKSMSRFIDPMGVDMGMGSAELGCAGMGCDGLGWDGLGWAGPGWYGLS